MIEVKNLNSRIGEKQILKDVSVKFEIGKNYIIAGSNGSGKSSLLNTIMGHPNHKIISGEIKNGEINLITQAIEEKSNMGLFLAFQNVPEIKGIKLGEYLRTIYNNYLEKNKKNTKPLSPFLFKRFIKKYLDEIGLDQNFIDRDLNVGFSGGEKRKVEILQMKLLEPKYIMLDEIDSGLDIDAIKNINKLINDINSKDNSIIIITHNFKIIENLEIDEVIILKDGAVEKIGDSKLINEVIKRGYNI